MEGRTSKRHSACIWLGVRAILQAIPLFAIAIAGLGSSLQMACASPAQVGETDDALGEYTYGALPPSCVGTEPRMFWAPPQRLHQQVCSLGQIDELVRDLTNGTALPLATDPNYAACLACAVSPESAFSFGALVSSSAGLSTNLGGCVAQLTGDFRSTSCGASIEKTDWCAAAAQQDCQTRCATDADRDACVRTSCERLIATASQCLADVTKAGAPAEACAVTNDPVDDARRILNLFCGP